MVHAQLSWRGAIWVGVPLGVLELGLVVAALQFTAQLSPPVAVLLGELLYVLLPAGVGFTVGYRPWTATWEGALAGMRAGLVSGGVVMFGVSVLLAVGLVHNLLTRPPGTHFYPGYIPALDIVATVVVWVLLAGFTAAGVGLSLLGGLGGAALARWRRGAARAGR